VVNIHTWNIRRQEKTWGNYSGLRDTRNERDTRLAGVSSIEKLEREILVGTSGWRLYCLVRYADNRLELDWHTWLDSDGLKELLLFAERTCSVGKLDRLEGLDDRYNIQSLAINDWIFGWLKIDDVDFSLTDDVDFSLTLPRLTASMTVGYRVLASSVDYLRWWSNEDDPSFRLRQTEGYPLLVSSCCSCLLIIVVLVQGVLTTHTL